MNIENDHTPFALVDYKALTFNNRDYKGVEVHKGDPLVITVKIRSTTIQKVLVDGRSSINIMYWIASKRYKSRWMPYGAIHVS